VRRRVDQPLDRRRQREAHCPKSPTGAHRFICEEQTLQTVPAECKWCHRRRRFRLPKRMPIYGWGGAGVEVTQ